MVNDFSRGGDSIGINVNELSTETLDKMKKVGVSKGDLENIAGDDGRISGKKEFKKLYKAVDTFDKDGKSNSIQTRDAKNAPTPSGELYDSMNPKSIVTLRKQKCRESFTWGCGKPQSRKQMQCNQSIPSTEEFIELKLTNQMAWSN